MTWPAPRAASRGKIPALVTIKPNDVHITLQQRGDERETLILKSRYEKNLQSK